jgi:hypothetical protein
MKYLTVCRLPGISLVSKMREVFLLNTGLSSDQITDFLVQLYEDLSGIDSEQSCARLKDGAVANIDEELLLEAATARVPSIAIDRVAVHWYVIAPDQEVANLMLAHEDYEVAVAFALRPPPETDRQIRDRLVELAAYTDERRGYCDTLWDGNGVGRQLVNAAIRRGAWKLLEKLLADLSVGSERGTFALARTLATDLPLQNQNTGPLIQQLLDGNSRLNDYWKDKIRQRLTE